MKKASKILAAILSLTLLFTLVGCNKYGSVQKAFENEGFKQSETLEGILDDVKSYFEKEDMTVTPHVFTKGLTCTVVIFEFKSNADLDKAIEENETIKGLLKDLSKSDYVNGNCLCVPVVCVSPSAKDVLKIFKNA